MKNFVKMFTAICFCGMMTAVFMSCSKSDEPGGSGDVTPVVDNTIVKAEATYKLTLSDGIKNSLDKAVDMKIEYYNEGKLETKTYTASGDNFTTTAKFSTIPSKSGMRITFTPKADLSGVGDDEEFDMQYSVEVSIKAYNSKGTQVKEREAKDGCKKTGMYIKEMAADKADFNTFETKLYFNVTKESIDLEK